MNPLIRRFLSASLGIAFAVGLLCLAGTALGADREKPPVNAFGASVRDAQGKPINYTREELAPLQGRVEPATPSADNPANVGPQGFAPAGAGSQAFWQYSIFGSGIGASNIVTIPAPAGSPREIIVGGNSTNNFGPDNFWQVLRRNPTTGNYDQLFVSPVYSAAIKRIALGNVLADSQAEIVVLAGDGRIYFYDLITRAELGHITTSRTDLQGLNLTDLNGDGLAEILATSAGELLVFGNTGSLLWQVTGAGGSDIVAGQMDNDPALEIATTQGAVVDCATHTIQWTRSGGLGAHLRLAPLPGAAYQQLIAASAWYDIYSYDVATQLPRWSISMELDIGAIEVADVDNDGTPELLAGDGQWGEIHVYNLLTQAQKWQTTNPEHGVTNIAVDDVDGDGVVDLLWGAGWSSTGADYLYVANTGGTHNIKWQSVDLQGPFLGPLIGDLDGDGNAELVICSNSSSSGYNGPRIAVFDLATLALRAISSPSLIGYGGANDMEIRDLEGDGRAEIIIAGSYSYDGLIDVLSFSSSNVFNVKWANPTRPSGSPFTFVEIADLDGNGTSEIIAGNNIATSGSEGVYVYIYDYPSTGAPWRSIKLASSSALMKGLVVTDVDGNGSKDIAALVSTGDLYTFDGPTRQLKNLKQQTGGTIIASRGSSPGLIVGDISGVGHFWKFDMSSYIEEFARQLGSAALDGLTATPDGKLWIGAAGRLKLRLAPDFRGVWWQSPVLGTGFGRFTTTDLSNGQMHVFSSAQHAVAGFEFEPVTPTAETILGNISTRLRVETGDNILIGGFIVGGSEPKKVIVRAIGPSLGALGVPQPLANPTLELHGPTSLIASNDDWVTSADKQVIIDSGLAPSNDVESALVATLPANNTGYTAIVRGLNNTTGTGVVEIYDLNPEVEAKMANISTRGRVQSGDNVLIAGTIVVGPNPRKVLVRAIGPSLQVVGRLLDPTLELRDSNGGLVEANDNWQNSSNRQAIIDSGLAPIYSLESAILTTLQGNNASYTAIVRGVSNSTGIGVVEVYAID